MTTARKLDEWNEEDGPVLWWRFPVAEPPYCGTPLDDDFPDYVTHWTTFDVPSEPRARPWPATCSACGVLRLPTTESQSCFRRDGGHEFTTR